jgi:hypothetical protein
MNANPPVAVRAVLLAYVQKMIDTFDGYENVSFEIMNEGDPDSDAWQEELVGYIHSHSSLATLRSSLYPGHSDLSASAYPDVSQFGKPVYLDTDHNCAGGALTPEQIDGLYCRGYNLLQLIAGTSADAELARIGRCATDASQCPACP